MKLAVLFAGQGSQKVGMGKDFYEQNEMFRQVVDSVSLDFDVKQLMFEDPMEQLSQTRYTQPCMATFAAGVTKMLEAKGVKPEYVAGLSLGEYSALHAAGVFDTQTFINLVAFRGKVMEEAAAGIECKMSAVMGLESSVLTDICNLICREHPENYVTVSNYNCTGQYVICGDKTGVELAEEKAKEAGAKRCMPLKVSGPFHTKFMKPAGEALANYMETVNFGEMKTPVVFNTTAKVLHSSEIIKDLLVKQVQSSIYMEDTLKYLQAQGVDTIIEVGPGKALSGFVKRTVEGITTYTIEDMEGFHKVMEAIGMED